MDSLCAEILRNELNVASSIWFLNNCIQSNGTNLFFNPSLLDDPEYYDEAMDEFNQSGHLYNNEGILFFDENNPSYYSLNYRIVGTLFQGLILLFGLLGNLLVVVVVFRTRSMHSPTNCYLVSLAVADCVVLIASVPNEILSYYVIGRQWIWGPIGCAIFTFMQNFGINSSSLSLTAFTVERYIAICHPIKAKTACTVKRAKKIIIGVWIFAFCYSAPWLGLTTTDPVSYKGHETVEMCTFKLSRKEYLGYFFTDIVVFYMIPLLLSCVLYGLIARVLFTDYFKKCPEVCRHDIRVSIDMKKSSRVQVVKMLVVVVVIFATLWLPYRGLLVYNSFATMNSRPSFLDLWFLMFAKTCVYINSAINPILYTAMSLKFRRAFQRIFLCGRRFGRFSFNSPRLPQYQGSPVGIQMRHLTNFRLD